jgi:hypothetical protein
MDVFEAHAKKKQIHPGILYLAWVIFCFIIVLHIFTLFIIALSPMKLMNLLDNVRLQHSI